MEMSAGQIFDCNHDVISDEMGTPESVNYFREQYITPAFEKSYETGQMIQDAFWQAVCDYQRSGFIQGFKAGVQLINDCMPGKALKTQARFS